MSVAIWNSETTQNLNIYLHNYETEAAIFLATKPQKNNYGMQLFEFFHTENTSEQQECGVCEELLCENYFQIVLVHLCCYEYDANAFDAGQTISTRMLLKLCQFTKTANFIATPIKKRI